MHRIFFICSIVILLSSHRSCLCSFCSSVHSSFFCRLLFAILSCALFGYLRFVTATLNTLVLISMCTMSFAFSLEDGTTSDWFRIFRVQERDERRKDNISCVCHDSATHLSGCHDGPLAGTSVSLAVWLGVSEQSCHRRSMRLVRLHFLVRCLQLG